MDEDGVKDNLQMVPDRGGVKWIKETGAGVGIDLFLLIIGLFCR